MYPQISFASNRLFSTFREVQKDGKTWMIVNGVPLVQGVLNGRFVPVEEFGAFANDWNDVPVVMRHPKRNGGSAKVPSSDVPVVGRFYNASIDQKANRLIGEFWLDKAMIENIEGGEDFLSMIGNNQPIEVSTGYWSESVPENGNWNGKQYNVRDRNIHPDHIALLPDEAGACSVKDGCGLNRNQVKICQNCEYSMANKQNAVNGSYEKFISDLHDSFYALMREREKRAANPAPVPAIGDFFIVDVFDDYVIAKEGNQLWKIEYTQDETRFYFADDREWTPVKKVERYIEEVAPQNMEQNVTGSLPAEGKKIYEAVYKQYKDKGLSDGEAAKRAWGAVKNAGWYQDKDGQWKKKTKKNSSESDDLLFELFATYSILKS